MWRCLGCKSPNYNDSDQTCWFCGVERSGTLRVGDSTPEAQQARARQGIDEQTKAVNGNYLVIPFIGKIKSGFFSSENAETVSRQLQSLINQYSQQGWEFATIAKVDIEVTPGCLAGLFGAKASYITFDQLIFRRTGFQT